MLYCYIGLFSAPLLYYYYMNIFSAYFEKPKNVFFASQEDNEDVLFVLRASFITNVPWVVLTFIFLMLPYLYMVYVNNNPGFSLISPVQLENSLIIVWYLIVVGYALERYITWYFNIYIVTNKRLIDVDFKPLFIKRVSETNYEKIEDTSYQLSNFIQTIFNYGCVYVQTAAEKREFEFNNVPNPAKVQDVISDYAHAAVKVN